MESAEDLQVESPGVLIVCECKYLDDMIFKEIDVTS